jgi:hypothetical protein
MTNQEFIKSEIFKDIGDYKNMSLLALSKKLPYWLRIINQKTGKSGTDWGPCLKQIYHLRNYCRDCDKNEMFIISRIQTGYGTSTKSYTRVNEIFWNLYVKQYKQLYFEALKHFNETKTANENVQCPCGGNYSSINKAKHFKTKKHLKYQIL